MSDTMIRRISDRSGIFPGKDYYSGKVSAYFAAYGGGYDFCRFYGFYDGSGALTGSAMLFNSGLTLCGSGDAAEIGEFVRLCGPAAAECPPALGERIFSRGYAPSARTMYRLHPGREEDMAAYGNDLSAPVPLMQAAEIVAGSFDGVDRSLWYTDVSHRVRHGVSRAYLYKGCAAAVLDFTAEGAGFVSSVAVRADQRGRGCAGELLRVIAAELAHENRKGYLWADRQSAGYYERLGLERVCGDRFFTVDERRREHGRNI